MSAENSTKIYSGLGAAPGRASGKAYVIRNAEDVMAVPAGSILVMRILHPHLAPLLPRVAGLVVEDETIAFVGSEAEAVFRMLKRPRRDVFEFTDGSEISLGDLPAGLIFDVLVVPGSEQLSAVLNTEPNENEEDKREKESLLDRLMAHF